ncbi:hypothetical protein SLA2020_407330 [Shorea laevis]
MDHDDRSVMTVAQNNQFVQSIIQQYDNGNIVGHMTITKQGWRQIATTMNTVAPGIRVCSLKMRYRRLTVQCQWVHNLLNTHVGFTWNEETNAIDASENAWDTVRNDRQFRSIRGRSFPLYARLRVHF